MKNQYTRKQLDEAVSDLEKAIIQNTGFKDQQAQDDSSQYEIPKDQESHWWDDLQKEYPNEEFEELDEEDPEYGQIQHATEIADVHGFSEMKFKGVLLAGDHFIAGIYGGKNGCGLWRNYIDDIGTLIHLLEKSFSKVWVLDLSNDACDDLWYLTLGMRG